MKRIALFSLLAAAALSTGTALAQGRYVVFEEETITGEIQLPEIQIFITRQNLNNDYDLELQESFVPKIVESADKKPF
ncbi:MAG: hypothetical protein GY913_34195 [Proteobacteria bacterium]|nr:hypothetical protein [Pseudomonadota bacterium]MCP4921981.1 hypothetical protein [Pseudomonadota bacterium]